MEPSHSGTPGEAGRAQHRPLLPAATTMAWASRSAPSLQASSSGVGEAQAGSSRQPTVCGAKPPSGQGGKVPSSSGSGGGGKAGNFTSRASRFVIGAGGGAAAMVRAVGVVWWEERQPLSSLEGCFSGFPASAPAPHLLLPLQFGGGGTAHACTLWPLGRAKGTPRPRRDGKLRILILMSDTGGGHRASAEALCEGFRELYGDKYHVSQRAPGWAPRGTSRRV